MIVGICGFGYSGSGAIKDFLKERDECSVSDSEFEFDLPYCPHGIQDLEYHLMIKNARYLSSDVAIHEFKKIINTLDSPKRHYRRIAGNQFKEISDQFIENITQIKWNGYAEVDHRTDSWLFQKVHSFIHYRIVRNIENKCKNKTCPAILGDEMYLSVLPNNFEMEVNNYLHQLIKCLGYDMDKIVVLDQPFEANQPENSMKYFDNAKAVVVDRDPRDLYVFVKKYLKSAGRFIPTDNVENYIKYHKLIRQTNSYRESSLKNILHLRFEDMVYNYENTAKKVLDFIGLSATSKNQMRYFDPKKSINNTQLFLRYPELKSDIETIEKELPEYLYPFQKSSLKPTYQYKPF